MESINPGMNDFARQARLPAQAYIDGIKSGDRTLLSQAITIVESQLPADQHLADQILQGCIPMPTTTIRVGITGSPGVGKSTLLDTLGMRLLEEKAQKIAVLTIDPSSSLTKGSILGDKTRMERLAGHPRAYIRPSAAGTVLGGVAPRTPSVIRLCEAAGYDWIFVETVGVGQSETIVHTIVDCLVLLLLPGGGDELQGIKRGIVEMADIIAIHKADQDRLALAERSKRAYQQAIQLFLPKFAQWKPPVQTCSSIEETGIDQLMSHLLTFVQESKTHGHWQQNRDNQALFWLDKYIEDFLKIRLMHKASYSNQFEVVKKEVMAHRMLPWQGAKRIVDLT